MKTSARTDLILTLVMTALTGTLVLLYSQLQPQDSTNKPGIPDFDNSIQAWLPAENVTCKHKSLPNWKLCEPGTYDLGVPPQVQQTQISSKPSYGDSPTLSSPNSGAR